MGPAGSGKTTVGKLLAAQLQWEFADADNFHSPANIEKMSRGIPLSDDDRIPWLHSLREAMLQWDAQHRNVVLACSALKRSYRELLQINSNVRLVYLKGSYELFRERLRSPPMPLPSTPRGPRNKSSRKSANVSRYLKMRRLLEQSSRVLQALAWVL